MDGAVKKGRGQTYFLLVVGFIVLGAGLVKDQPFGLLGIFLILYASIPPVWRMMVGSTGTVTVDHWMATLPTCKYKFGSGDSGIAFDEDKQNLHLFDTGYSKIYPFSDIRGFKTNIASGGKLFAGYGTGLAAAAHGLSVASANRAQEKQNQEETGLFISVKDIDRPVWRIRFDSNAQEEAKLQARWMEIFEQVVNKN